MLCDFQESVVEAILKGLASARAILPTFLLVGSPGVGKRRIASEIASRVAIEFAEVRLDASPADVIDALCGNAINAEAQPEVAPGELGHVNPRLLYLSHLEALHPSLFQTISRILSKKTYTDGAGRDWKISENLWVSAGLSLATGVNVGPTHWITTGFHLNVGVPDPVDASCFELVAVNVLAELFGNIQVNSDIGHLLAAHKLKDQNFYAVRRWVVSAYAKSSTGLVEADSLKKAIFEDLEWLIRGIEYRGRRLELRHVDRWLSQISSEYQPLAVRLLRLLAQKYFIAADEYYTALGTLIQRAEVQTNQVVSFCKWQPLGKSAPHLAHDLKNRARWKVGPDIDFTLPEESWPQLSSTNPAFVLPDDFVGSGMTLSKLGKTKLGEALHRLSSRYPNATFILVLMVAYEEPIAKAIQSINKFLSRPMRVCIYKLLTDVDRCFSSSSGMLPLESERKYVRDLCLSSRSKFFRSLDSTLVFGFENTASFFAFFNSVPNNSLPILWHDQADWFALLPASGILT